MPLVWYLSLSSMPKLDYNLFLFLSSTPSIHIKKKPGMLVHTHNLSSWSWGGGIQVDLWDLIVNQPN